MLRPNLPLGSRVSIAVQAATLETLLALFRCTARTAKDQGAKRNVRRKISFIKSTSSRQTMVVALRERFRSDHCECDACPHRCPSCHCLLIRTSLARVTTRPHVLRFNSLSLCRDTSDRRKRDKRGSPMIAEVKQTNAKRSQDNDDQTHQEVYS